MKQKRTREILKAIRCCRDDFCNECPMLHDFCDELKVEMESLPAQLIDMIEDVLEGVLKDGRAS